MGAAEGIMSPGFKAAVHCGTSVIRDPLTCSNVWSILSGDASHMPVHFTPHSLQVSPQPALHRVFKRKTEQIKGPLWSLSIFQSCEEILLLEILLLDCCSTIFIYTQCGLEPLRKDSLRLGVLLMGKSCGTQSDWMS